MASLALNQGDPILVDVVDAAKVIALALAARNREPAPTPAMWREAKALATHLKHLGYVGPRATAIH